MDFERAWETALKHTEIIRARVQALSTYSDTKVPYILLSESDINSGDTVVRKGEVLVERPALVLPPNIPQFRGFEFGTEEESPVDENALINFLIVRGVTLPSLKYNNQTHSLDIYEGKLSNAVREYAKTLEQQENVHSGLIVGPQEFWQFSILIFVISQIAKNADADIRRLLNDYHKRKSDDA